MTNVRITGAALCNPVWTSSIGTTADLGVAFVGFVLLTAWRTRPLWVVLMGALAGMALAQIA